METRSLEFAKTYKEIFQAVENVQKLISNEKERLKNLAAINSSIKKVSTLVENSQLDERHTAELKNWVDAQSSIIDSVIKEQSYRFANELNSSLFETFHEKIEGNFPVYYFREFTIEIGVNFEKVTIWFGDKEEKIKELKPDCKEIISTICDFKSKTGSRLSPEEFVERLNAACKMIKDDSGIVINGYPITKVLFNFAMLLQNSAFRNNPTKENFKSYSRIDFGFDLYNNIGTHKFTLVGAVKAFAGSKDKYLFVPSQIELRNNRISHIKI